MANPTYDVHANDAASEAIVPQFNTDRTPGAVDDHLQQPADQHVYSLNHRRIGSANDRP